MSFPETETKVPDLSFKIKVAGWVKKISLNNYQKILRTDKKKYKEIVKTKVNS